MEKFTLNDIAGYADEKEELKQIIDMLQNFDRYKEQGIYLSKGMILSGAPGVGKTLFAKVLASEANVPFFHFDGTSYSENNATKKLKEVFKEAIKRAPSIIFIDELNAFVGDYDSDDNYTRRNLSTLLKLIDGINGSTGVFVVGASSDRDNLDPAVYRSGRMDKYICLNYPDAVSRAEIIDHYFAQSSIDLSGVNKWFIVAKTAGLNGADIKTVVNETLLECVYKGEKPTNEIFFQHIIKIADKDLARRSDDSDAYLYGLHDIGHLIVANELLEAYSELSVEYANNLLGRTSMCFMFSDDEYDEDDDYEDDDYDEDEDDDDEDDDDEAVEYIFDTLDVIEKKVAVVLGGLAAEEVVLGERYAISKGDLNCAQSMIWKAFEKGLYGFEYLNWNDFYYVEISQSALEKREAKCRQVIEEQYERAKHIIEQNVDVIKKLHSLLLKKRKLKRSEIAQVLSQK